MVFEHTFNSTSNNNAIEGKCDYRVAYAIQLTRLINSMNSHILSKESHWECGNYDVLSMKSLQIKSKTEKQIAHYGHFSYRFCTVP